MGWSNTSVSLWERAILGPADPVAVTSVVRRPGASDRISTMLKGKRWSTTAPA
jgi:NhaP-type Na+/H+ or K+/H+ antiporter